MQSCGPVLQSTLLELSWCRKIKYNLLVVKIQEPDRSWITEIVLAPSVDGWSRRFGWFTGAPWTWLSSDVAWGRQLLTGFRTDDKYSSVLTIRPNITITAEGCTKMPLPCFQGCIKMPLPCFQVCAKLRRSDPKALQKCGQYPPEGLAESFSETPSPQFQDFVRAPTREFQLDTGSK